MTIWSGEIKELEILYESFKGNLPDLGKELDQVFKTQDANVVMLYSRRCLEVIITDLCECELKRPRKTEPLKGIIDKLNMEEKVPSHIITSMHGLNSLSTYGTHPKEFDPEQVKPALNSLAIVIKWYIKYLGTRDISGIAENNIKAQETEGFDKRGGTLKPGKKLSKSLIASILIIVIIVVTSVVYYITRQTINISTLEKSIAVLPFRNDSPDDSTQYFMDGVMEELLTKLQKIKELRVLGRTSVEQYRSQNKTIPQIAKELGVNYIIEGSGQKSGNSLRMRVQLIRVNKEGHIWANNFEQENLNLDDYFKIQTSFAEAIAKELNTAITPDARKMMEKIPTTDMEAYNAYLKGGFYLNKITDKDMETAMEYFEIAKERDPEFALAYAGIAIVWASRQQMGIVQRSETTPKTEAAIMKALELDSTQSDIHSSLAGIKVWTRWDWKGGEASYRKAIELNPNNANAHSSFSHLLNILGRPEEAMNHIKIALELDPFNPQIKAFYGIDLMFVHRFDEAIKAFQETLELSPYNLVAGNIVNALYFAGREDEAIEWLRNRSKDPEFLKVLDEGYSEAGFAGAMKRLADLNAERSKSFYIGPRYIGQLYVLAGDINNAMIWLEKAYNEHDPNLPYVLKPEYDKIRDDPRFQDLCRRMNLPYKIN